MANKPTRRQMLMVAAAAAVPRAAMAAGEPPRLARKDSFFGLHFDLHPSPDDQALGRDLNEEMIGLVLKACRPDFIQYDSKGHVGYLGFPSQTGMSAPHIVQDSLALWRKVTAREGVALYNHFSGVLDGHALQRHPEWARVGPDGKADQQETSTFSDYEDKLMIPELLEAARNYDLDGAWVDGDCWAVKPDYSATAQRAFRAATGLTVLPRSEKDAGWQEFLDLQREQFRRYVKGYVDALHRAKPGFQITSNWLYSTFAPERPTLPLDYLSGDIADQSPVHRARLDARYFSMCGLPWDLMSWGFESDPQFGHMSHKPVKALQQEAAIVLAQGGGYQIYYTPTRAGWIDGRIIQPASEVAKFCRARQQLSHRSETIPEAGVLFSGRSLYRSGHRVFGEWGAAVAPADGAVNLLIGCGYSTDVIPDWRVDEVMARYPLVVVPDWDDIGDGAAQALDSYVMQGGRLLLCGAANAALLAKRFGLSVGKPEKRDLFVAEDDGFAMVSGLWAEVNAAENEAAIAYAYRGMDTRKDRTPIAIDVRRGRGQAVICPGPLMSAYAAGSTPIILRTMARVAAQLVPPRIRFDHALPDVEVVLRRKNDDTLVHLVNIAGAVVSGKYRHSGIVTPTGPLGVSIRMQRAPGRVLLEPGGITIAGDYNAGRWRGTVPTVDIHAILRFTG